MRPTLCLIRRMRRTQISGSHFPEDLAGLPYSGRDKGALIDDHLVTVGS